MTEVIDSTLSRMTSDDRRQRRMSIRRGHPRLRRVLFEQARRLGQALVLPVITIGVWAAFAKGRASGALVPSPLDVVHALSTWISGPPAPATAAGINSYSGTWLDSAIASSGRVLAGYACGSAVGVLLGMVAGYFRSVGRLLEPYVNLLRAIPIIGWLPISLVIFGFGLKSAIFLIGLGSFFPVFVNTVGGVRAVERNLVRVGQMAGATSLQLIRTAIFPAALPSIVDGLRIAMGFSWILVIVAEWEAVHSGLGYVLLQSYSFLRYDYVVAAMISVGVVGFIYDQVLKVLLNPFVRWRRLMSHAGD